MKKTLVAVLAVAFVSSAAAQPIPPQAKERAAELVGQMTLDEKIDYIGGYNEFYIRAVPRLGIPEIRMADGPQGVRNNTRSTMFPCGVAAAATWDRALVRDMGRGLGQDARARGVHIMLGPGVNIYRSPLCGRNFEYFGEDPYLASETAVQYIEGMQSEGVMATIKHFAGNNQEWDRHQVSSDIDERTLHEIYLPAFRKAVEQAGVGAVMSSYNLVNGQHATENEQLAVDILRGMWGFEGIFMSDWNATYSAEGAANRGLDLEMPSARFMNARNLRPLIESGVVSERTIDLKCQHILQTLIAFGFLDRQQLDPAIPECNPFSDGARGCGAAQERRGFPAADQTARYRGAGTQFGQYPDGRRQRFRASLLDGFGRRGHADDGQEIQGDGFGQSPFGERYGRSGHGLHLGRLQNAGTQGRVLRQQAFRGNSRADARRYENRLQLEG